MAKSFAKLTLVNPKEWDKFKRRLSPETRARILEASDVATRQAAMMLVRDVRNEITQGVPPANAGLTRELKGSSKPLVNKGRLFQSVTFKRVKRAQYFVGVLFRDRNYNIAQALHDGATIPVTTKMRNLFKLAWIITKRINDKRRARDTQAAARSAAKEGKSTGLPAWGNVRPAALASKGEDDSRATTGAKKKRGKRKDPLAFLKSPRARELVRMALRNKVVIRPLGKSTSVIRIPGRPFIRRVFERPSVKNALRAHWQQAIERAWRAT